MKYKIIIIILLFFCPIILNASCKKDGYTILTLNGIFTNEEKSKDNAFALKRKLNIETHNNQPIFVDYVYNETHLLGVKDVLDAINQKIFEKESIDDYDLQNMISDASQKIKTEKILLVAHSQGNFYSNSFYNILTKNGLSKNSIGVYGVASPASYVAGEGKYITSSTDKVINLVRANGVLNVLKPNVDINFIEKDANGHSFSDIYLRYEGVRIIKEIKNSLDNLKESEQTEILENCIPELNKTLSHKINGMILSAADFVLDSTKSALVFLGSNVRNLVLNINNKLESSLANAVESIDGVENLTTLNPEILNQTIILEQKEEKLSENSNPEELKEKPKEEKILDEKIESEQKPEEKIITENPETNTETKTETIETKKEIETPNLLLGTGGYVASEENSSDNQKDEEDNSEKAEADTTPPVITLNGNEFELIPLGSNFVDPGASAKDNIDAEITISVSGLVDTTKIGLYEITYSVKDTANNSATKTRKIRVDDGAKIDNPNAVAVSGNYAYVVSEKSNSFEIIDIGDKNNFIHKSYLIHDHDKVEMFAPKSVAVLGNYAYVVSYSNNLLIIDISNPMIPEIKSTLNYDPSGANLYGPNSIIIQGNYAYVTSYLGGALEIIDISNPLNATHVSSFPIPSPTSLTIHNNYAYVTSFGENSLKIVDISNPTTPTLKGFIYNGANNASIGNPQSVAIYNNYAYVVSREDNTLEILDISDPTHPAHINKIITGSNGANFIAPIDVKISGNYIYVLSYVGSDLEIFDITNPIAPTHVYTITNGMGGGMLHYPNKIFISDNYLFTTVTLDNALEMIDISNPLSPIHKNKILNGEFSHTDPVLSSDKKITSFVFEDLEPDSIGVIDETLHTISLHVPSGTDVTNLVPSISISLNSNITPSSKVGQNFTNPVIYKVTAEDNTTTEYNVTVLIDNPTNEDQSSIPIGIESYTLNGTGADISVNPIDMPITLYIKSSKNVNWLSIKIENSADSGMYKIFQSGSGCVDWTNTCEKSWDGTLTRGGLLINGNYKIKIHMKDESDNDFEDYLTPHTINVIGI